MQFKDLHLNKTEFEYTKEYEQLKNLDPEEFKMDDDLNENMMDHQDEVSALFILLYLFTILSKYE